MLVRWGTGPVPVLLLHGFSHAASSWDRMRTSWSDDLTALAPDLPGHRGEPLPEGASFEQVVDILAELIQSQPPGPVAVVGYSQGARLGLALALRHPDRVRRLVMESGSPGIEDEAEQARRRTEDAAKAERLRRDGIEPFMRHWEALPIFAGVRALPERDQEHLRDLRRAHDPEGLARALEVMGQGAQPWYGEALRRLACPALFLAGARDEKYAALARGMAARAPRGRAALFDCGHAPHLELTGPYAAAVLDFLS